jgi:hypothetical protein
LYLGRVRCLVVLCLLAGLAHATPATPIRVAIECEDSGRTKACPAFLLGFIDTHKVLSSAPRASADVVLYVAASEIALVDRIHLRFVSTVVGAPREIEVDVEIDTRADDDTQREQLEPAFLRGLALIVAARHPSAVTVAFTEPEGLDPAKADTTPWGVAVTLGGSGNRTEKYKSFSGYSELLLARVTREMRFEVTAGASGSLNRQPDLITDDGTRVSLDSEQWSVYGGSEGGWLYDDCWSFGGAVRASREDPKGQYRYQTGALVGVEWDKYAADDPRGNRLALLYYAGYKVERYNLRNELGERFAHYPVHGFTASGNIRKDKVSIGLSLTALGEVLHPTRRHNLSASPFLEVQLGGHVDLNLSFSITKRALPAPDESLIDPGDYELLSRLSYAEPLSMNGSLNLTIHWDHTNGARNDRFTEI